jgi:PPOX class probable F420-dependent enzyme
MDVSLPEAARTAITSGRNAHLVTLNEDGSTQVTVVWVGLEGDEIVCGHLAKRKKVRNVLRDPRVVLSMETGGHDERGLDNYLVATGRARVTEGGAPSSCSSWLASIWDPMSPSRPWRTPRPATCSISRPRRSVAWGPGPRTPADPEGRRPGGPVAQPSEPRMTAGE